ncbi:MAG TPA: SEC-C metal-binding domain-containing protein, partial [Patescibacteria group bacterium]
LAGMTGTALTEAEEFAKIYNLDVTVIPTNKPLIRQELSDRIYKSEMGKFQAVVREIKERHEKGQPVLVGTISIQKNELLGQLLDRSGVPHQALNAKNHEKEASIIAQAGRTGAVTIATNMAGRGVDIILGGNPASEAAAGQVRQLGGLHVIGTERHDSRRIDNQLRGRAGRQGDPGSSQFYVSLEDDLMRIFGSDRIKNLMTALKVPEDMPIENKIVTRSLETAQKKVEGHNFDIRKHVVEYDDVLNKHREVIYKKRREILELEQSGLSVKDKILEMVKNEIEQVVGFHTQSDDQSAWDLKEVLEVIGTIFQMTDDEKSKLNDIYQPAASQTDPTDSRIKIIEYLMSLARDKYQALEGKVKETVGNDETFRQIEKGILLRSYDQLWVEHLEAITHLRRGIGLRGYGQRDPLVEYKKEAFKMFNILLASIQKQVVYSVYKISVGIQMAPSLMQRSGIRFSAPAKTGQTQSAFAQNDGNGQQKQVAVQDDKFKNVGRNDPCPCGSGKKFKKCHGA